MLSGKKKLQIFAGFAALLLFAVGIGCSGFFVDPTLTSLTVGPQASIGQGQTVQESAVGTYNDGSQKNVTNVFWSSSDIGIATISTGGLVTGVSPGSATITGASGTVNGTSAITVTLTGITAIQVTPTSASIVQGDSEQYTATATANGKQVIVSDSVNWAVDNNINNTVSIDTTGNLTTTSGSITTNTVIHVTATDPTTGIISNAATLTITVQ